MSDQQPSSPTRRKSATPPDFIKREITAMTRMLLALRSLPRHRAQEVLNYVNGLFTAAALDHADQTPERPDVKVE